MTTTSDLADAPGGAYAGDDPVLTVTTTASDEPGLAEVAVTWRGAAPLISEVLPAFDSLGLRVARHTSARATDRFDIQGWIGGVGQEARLDQGLRAVLSGRAERDDLNRLILRHRMEWREVALLRALCRYARQAGVPLGIDFFHRTLVAHGEVAQALLDHFRARFDPAARAEDDEGAARSRVQALLERVDDLEQDRVLGALAEVVAATVRTSYFQVGPDGRPLPRLTLKIEPRRLTFPSHPVPLVETFVYSPHMEGLHVRMGRVARGGIRHSARTEDYRTEVVALMKAQAVKNSLIVPAGAKGAFILRRQPGDERAGDAEVARGYAQFVRGLLDVTDNRVGSSSVTPPGVRARDAADPYLVVAADKGTASFSDLANTIAAEYGFWLGDAFASGGSNGYDHKRLGVTARGAWVSVESHLDELGFDPDRDRLTVVGIGDMSGDVFGNGMLSSDRIRLLAAFDHRHIFLDPDPDPLLSLGERRRLFERPRSSWADYDPKLISVGGGVYPRGSKRVPVSPEVRQALGIAEEVTAMTPHQLIAAILRAPVTLLWNGGVGTYVKASSETAAEVADKANDPLRVDAADLRCQIVAEGGNLGVTQRGRIEYALAGGRINADFVDNSAGVDTSDREVNLKILLAPAVATGGLARSEADAMLAAMSDDVVSAVLTDNRLQALAISLAEFQAPLALGRHARLIRFLEAHAGLDRRLEHLPDEEEIERRRRAGRGLTRPEIAVILAWSKIAVRSDLLASGLPEDPALAPTVMKHFPPPARIPDLIGRHPLGREIAATVVANDVVNQAGPGFFLRVEERTGASLAEAAAAFIIAGEVLGLSPLWAEVSDRRACPSAAARLCALRLIQALLERASTWMLRNRRWPLSIRTEVDRLAPLVAQVGAGLDRTLGAADRRRAEEVVATLTGLGMPVPLAERVSSCLPLHAALDIADGARRASVEVERFAAHYFAVGDALDLEWLRGHLAEAPGDLHWTSMAKASLADDVFGQQRRLATAVVDRGDGMAPEGAVAAWLADHRDQAARYRRLVDDQREASAVDLAMLTVAVQQLRELARTGLDLLT